MKKVTRFETDDGELFVHKSEARRHEAMLYGREKPCEVCKTEGQVDGEPITKCVLDEEATGWGGAYARPVYKDVIAGYNKLTCTVCKGFGYLLLLLILCGCSTNPTQEEVILQEVSEVRNQLPPQADYVHGLGNNWFIFELEGRRFLYRRKYSGNIAHECITELTVQEDELDLFLESL